jgi:hypothetical protein
MPAIMPLPNSFEVPLEQLHKLEFLLGETEGLETLYPPEGSPVQFKAVVVGAWESCERFVRLDFYADIPGIGVESFRAMITYSTVLSCYRMWAFASSQEEPMHLTGNFEGHGLVLVSDPTPMYWGLQRIRFTISPLADDTIELLGERWEPDGYKKYCSVVFRHSEVHV